MILQVAEGERLTWAGLCTCGKLLKRLCGYRAGEVAAVLVCALDLTNTLHAEGALLHDAHRTGHHIGVELEIERLWPRVGVVVEPPRTERTSVAAVPGTRATVVDHRVETIDVVVGRKHRTHILAAGVATLLTHQRDEANLIVVANGLPVAVDADPAHLSAFCHLLLSDNRQAVLGVAGNGAGTTTGTRVGVDRHGEPIGRMLRHLVELIDAVFLETCIQGEMVNARHLTRVG